ncbi:MAG: GIY-YIG nuclease family protein [Fimbriimonadaceae bacterium]|nr:GIY-YIG nuclease family protein [Fimbriimonadaceae bacterium]
MLPEGGWYQLLIPLAAPLSLRVGALGEVLLPAGWLVYTGSMQRGLVHRLRRHAARRKPLRWHVDYLTSRVPPTHCRVWSLSSAVSECGLHQALLRAGGSEPVRGFGSSDCRCGAHLAHFTARPAPLAEWQPLPALLPGAAAPPESTLGRATGGSPGCLKGE